MTKIYIDGFLVDEIESTDIDLCAETMPSKVLEALKSKRAVRQIVRVAPNMILIATELDYERTN